MLKKSYRFTAKVWLYTGDAAWHFVTLPVEMAQEIDDFFAHVKRGWGSLPVTVTIGNTTWRTSIFPDKQAGSYMLPLKAQVRAKEKIKAKDEVAVSIDLTE
jgi:hypothetical protein